MFYSIQLRRNVNIFKVFKYQQRIKLFLRIYRHERSVMYFCNRYQLSTEFNAFV